MKNRMMIPLALSAAAALAMSGTALANDNGYGTQKVVYHVNYDDTDRYMGAMGNIQNHINAVGADNMEIKVVMHGDGLGLLDTARNHDDLRARVDNLKLQDVEFQVCANTLAGRNIDLHEDLYDAREADIIPSGVAHISHLQNNGYTYSRP
ncbi:MULTISPECIES: DsrE family protein [unclassified Thioalkalivibrio]|uniref:DsrE family protein n=1 Tax=unclassified Thioalkalivibrio TaxID=2621013 RepID=UPI000476C8DF|nr:MULTISPECIES: DsrE family protein [unclassified Thioalkalivibrio]